mgnify:CR=1 FL=1
MSSAVGVLRCCRGVEVVRVEPSELASTARLVRNLAAFESRDFVECDRSVRDGLSVVVVRLGGAVERRVRFLERRGDLRVLVGLDCVRLRFVCRSVTLL